MPFEPEQTRPRVSVGILTRNGGQVFERVMESLCAQKTPWSFEVVCLDSGSTDGTARLAAKRGARVVSYAAKPFKFGPARDALFEQCRGEVVVTISQDVVPAREDWLEKLVRPILEGEADTTVGEQIGPPGGYAFYWDYHGSWMRSVAVRFDQAHGRIAISCANLALRRSVWEKLRFGQCATIEDRAMQVKLHRDGYRMMQVKEAISFHGHDYAWKDLWGRVAGFAMGWAELGWPYTRRRLVRDLMQPSRYAQTAEAFLGRQLHNWKELVYPIAMCFMQYAGSRKAGR